MKLILSVVFLVACIPLSAQKNGVKYVKTINKHSDGTVQQLTIEQGNHEKSLFFSKEIFYSGSFDKPYAVLIHASDTLDSSYFNLTLWYSAVEDQNELSVYHQLNYFGKDISEEIVELSKTGDSIQHSHMEVFIDGDSLITYHYRLSDHAFKHYESMAKQHLDSIDLRSINGITRPFQENGDLFEKSYYRSYRTEDSLFTYCIKEQFFDNTLQKDSVLHYKDMLRDYGDYNNKMPLLPKKNDKTRKRRRNWLPKPYYLNPKYTKRIEKGHKYEKRFDTRQAPGYQIYYEIFYQ